MSRRWMLGLAVGLTAAGMVLLGALRGWPGREAQEGQEGQEGRVVYDEECQITNFESTVVARVVYGGATFLLVDTVSGEGFYFESVIVADNAGCVQRTPVFEPLVRPGQGLPGPVAVAFARARWRLALRLRGQGWVENRLATMDVGGSVHSLDLYSEDLVALKGLGVQVPGYLRGIDQFESRERMRAYYRAVIKGLPVPVCEQGQVHC